MDLETQTARRLEAAGVTYNDPALVYIRAWNARAYARGNAGEQRSSSGSDHRGRGADSGGNGAGSSVEARQRAGAQSAGGELVYLHRGRRAGLRHT